ncbi:hypothetical protein OG874_32675 [Nocardia sp. NBC_00565]|uniref:hypothetical protein n=1 Tax=Nocardia sp. NBC_00565 TaxID=2975993 RepID=UPI002E80BE72|nr:hypothetical protein [Nocardia sp. NBC_00565]WUC01518.1 hypothetical protein OG874_32675 [Nocardia sp. NBC_00565]
MWIVLGWVVVLGLPSAVLAAVILWPERIPPDRTVEAIQRRLEEGQTIHDVHHGDE